jgi:uncharacterized repeat protein (TIGR01451 family)
MKSVYKIFMIIIILTYLGIYPVLADETEWVDPQEKTLRLKESVTRDGFIIEASDFYESSALITVYDTNHGFLTSNITRINDSFTVNDRLNITVINLQDVLGNISAGHGVGATVDQWVRIQTRVQGTPSPSVSIFPYEIKVPNNMTIIRHTYTPGSELSINFSIRNEGKGVLKNLTLSINSTFPLLSGENLNHELPDLEAGNESDIITVRFKAPLINERMLFPISAEAIGNDIMGRTYQASDSIYIEVVPSTGKRIDLNKYVSEKIYMGDIAVVTISVKNNISQSIQNAILTDTLPAGIESVDSNLTWNVSLGPYEMKSISYTIKPQKPGIYYFLPGSSIIEYQGEMEYNAKLSNLVVNGPYVELKKSANTDSPIKGQNIIITIDARNTGDATAIVKISDSVPTDYSLPPGKYTTETNTLVLHPGDETSFSYALNATAVGSFVLPPANATVFDQFLYQDERYTQRTSSNNLILKVSESSILELPTSVAVSTPQRTVVSEGTSTETSVETRGAAGFAGYDVLIVLFTITWVIKRASKGKL